MRRTVDLVKSLGRSYVRSAVLEKVLDEHVRQIHRFSNGMIVINVGSLDDVS